MRLKSLHSLKWLGAALIYAVTSMSMIAVNKSVLTINQFPSIQFVGVIQMIITVVITQLLCTLNIITLPNLSLKTLASIMPLPLLSLANLIAGLGSTKSLSIPMFTVLRRFSVLFVMIGEVLILKKRFSVLTLVTVICMISGVLVASLGDLAFEPYGYGMVTLNNIITACYTIYVKKVNDNQDIGRFGIVYYNSIVSLVLGIPLLLMTQDINTIISYPKWADTWFVIQFLMCTGMGYLLNFTNILCTGVCGALASTVIGVLKNSVMTYAGMGFGGDYIFSWTNFIGITISTLGGVVYSLISMSRVERTRIPEARKRNVGEGVYIA